MGSLALGVMVPMDEPEKVRALDEDEVLRTSGTGTVPRPWL